MIIYEVVAVGQLVLKMDLDTYYFVAHNYYNDDNVDLALFDN